MFRKSRWKIVLLIMSVLIFLFLGILGIIYAFSYNEVTERNREMLTRYAQWYSLENQPGEETLPQRPLKGQPLEDMHTFRLSTFYSVAFSADGEVLATDNGKTVVYDSEELVRLAWEVRDGKKTEGIIENLIYMREEKEDYTLIAFMDNTVMQESMTTLFRYTLAFGGVGIILIFFLSLYLSKRIVQPLEESYRKQRQFISDAGHELKTPVAVISTNAELLEREIGANQWLSNIQYENGRAGALISQLLELARTENRNCRQMEKTDFGRIITGEMLPFECIAFENGITLTSEVMDGLYINGNPLELKQLVSILLDNAMQYCADEKTVALTLKREKNCAKFSVVNSGKEIPKEQRTQIFERFYRADAARGGEGAHYGLGLSIARAIVTAHRGKIEVFCHDGKVEFAVRIPLCK